MITSNTPHPCPIVAKELALIEAEFSRRKSAVINAAGLIAEAEALAEALKERLPMAQFCPLVHAHDRDCAQVHLYVWGGHLAFFEALAAMGIACREAEPITYDERGKSRRTLTLDGFDVTVLAEAEIVQKTDAIRVRAPYSRFAHICSCGAEEKDDCTCHRSSSRSNTTTACSGVARSSNTA